jgi:hypothetical protein
MALTAVEKCAGKWFRDQAAKELEQERRAGGESAACSPQVRYFRHECPRQEGRTRSISLGETVLTSPETWVTWKGDALGVISREEAERLVAADTPVEFETVLAGKFSFTFKTGRCPKCRLQVVSAEGVLRDARPVLSSQQGDLATFTQGMNGRVTGGLRREST